MIPANPSQAVTPAPRYFVERIALLYCAPLIVNGFAMPFFPVWLDDLSMSDFEIGIVLAVPMFVRVLTAPLVGLLADRLQERANVLIWSGVLSLMTAIALFFTDSFWPVLIVYAVQGAVYSPYIPIVEAITLTGVRRWGFDYGIMRLWGSLAFVGATMLGGEMIGIFSGSMVLPAMAIGFVLTIVMGIAAPRVGKAQRPSAAGSLLGSPTPRALRQPDLQMLLIGVTLVNGSHAMLFAFSALYWQSIGFSGFEIGVLWSAAVLAEVVIFVFARQMVRHFSIWTMILSGCGLAVLRWILFPMDLGFWGYFVLQCFHAFTFATMHTGMQIRLVEKVSEAQEASAQGLYFFYTGIFTAIFTFLSGYFYSWYGVQGFYFMSVFALIGTGFAVVSLLAQPQSAGSGGKTSEPS